MFELLSYFITIFLYVFMRIKRDSEIVRIIGQEGTSMAKFVSLVVLFILSLVIGNFMKNSQKKTIWEFSLMIIFAILLSIEMGILPKFFHNSPSLFLKLIGNLDLIVFYVTSEIFALLISSQLWGIINETNVPKSSVFIGGQLGLIAASSVFLIFPGVKLVPLIILIPFLLLLSMLLKNRPQNQEESENKAKRLEKTSLWLIPITTLFCSVCAGLIDPLAKYSLVSSFGKTNYTKTLSCFWILQSITTIIANLLLETCTKFWLTSALLFINSLSMVYFMVFWKSSAVYMICFSVLFLKILKYSSHSPLKEKYLSINSDLLLWDGFFSRLGKNSTAIFLSIFFIYGYTWNDIYIYIPFVLLLISSLWFFTSSMVSKNYSK